MRLSHPNGSTVHLAYCTNVHAAEDFAGMLSQLDRFAVPVRDKLGVDVLGLGLWLAAPVAAALAADPVLRSRLYREMTANREGPPEVGTKVREVLVLGGREYVTDTAVTEVGPGMSYRFAGAGTSGAVRGRRSVVPATSRTAEFAYDVELEPDAIPRLARPALRWWLQRSLRRDLHRLRTLIVTAP